MSDKKMKTLGDFREATAHLSDETELQITVNDQGWIHVQNVNVNTASPGDVISFLRWGRDRGDGVMRAGTIMRRSKPNPSEFDILQIDVITS